MPAGSTTSVSFRGTIPPYFSSIARAAPMIAFALFRKNGIDDISLVKVVRSASAKSFVVIYFLKSGVVNLFTALSVHCAERMTAATNWNGVICSSSLFGTGYSFFKYATIFWARAARSPDTADVTAEELQVPLAGKRSGRKEAREHRQ